MSGKLMPVGLSRARDLPDLTVVSEKPVRSSESEEPQSNSGILTGEEMSNVYEMIKQAIVNRQQVHATFDEHERLMCPHAIGYNKDDRAQALFYQFGGSSSSGLSPDPEKRWRCLPVEGLSDVTVVDGEWHTAGNHSQPQTCIDEIDVEIDY